jgi:hypothetical protein
MIELEESRSVLRAGVGDHHADLQLFKQDRYKRSSACLLYPAADRATALFMKSLTKPQAWLASADLAALDDQDLPTIGQQLDQIKAALHGDDATELSQRVFPLEYLAAVLWHCMGRNEHYLAQNSFKGWPRASDNVNQITSCWIDLDYYKLKDSELRRQLDDDESAVSLILHNCTGCVSHKWFVPTQIIRSGRGLYVKWIFSHFLSGAASPRWRACMVALVERFKEFGVDPAARDAARVLRVTGSLNGKSKTVVRVLHDAKPILFDDLADALLPRKRLSQADRWAIKSLTANAAARFGPKARTEKTNTLTHGKSWPLLVAAELALLAHIRGAGAIGHIELIVFLALNFQLMAGQVTSRAEFDSRVAELGGVMHADLKQLNGKVGSLWSRHELGRSMYRFKRSTIIDRVSITAEELTQLPCLSKQGGIGERKPPVQTRTELSAQQERARLLERSGLQLGAIARQLNVHPRTVKRWLIPPR